MTELISVVHDNIINKLALKTVIINAKGDMSVDGAQLLGLDGKRTLKLFSEGVEQDIAEYGITKTVELYRKKARIPGSLGYVLQASAKLSRMLDVNTITSR